MDAIILSAGIGSRTKLHYPKQFVRLGGLPLFIHAIKIIKKSKNIDKIILTVIPDKIEEFESILSVYDYEDVICVKGGETRQQSVYNALKYCTSDRVLIHEAARPFITSEFIDKMFLVKEYVVTSAKRISTTVFDGYSTSFPNRDLLWDIQLPQIFDKHVLIASHEIAKHMDKIYNDDTSLVFEQLGYEPYIVEGIEENFKITTPNDIKLMEMMYREFDYNNWRK